MITSTFFLHWIESLHKINKNFINFDIINDAIKNQYLFDQININPRISAIKGELFEQLCKYIYIKSNYKTVYLYKDIPHFLKQKLKLPNRDEGFDLIVSKDNINYIAIQCKWRANINHCIKKQYISDFVREINKSNISKGIIFTNVNKINVGYKNDNIKWFSYENLTKFVDNNKEGKQSFLNFIDGCSKNIKINIDDDKNVTELRYYQKDAVNTLVKLQTPRMQCIMACGTGKSIVILETFKKLYSTNRITNCVILVPSLYLINQIYERFKKEFKKRLEILCICSDMDKKTISFGETDKCTEDKIYDNFISKDHEFIFTTDIDIVKERLKKPDIIVISTYQSSHLLKNSSIDCCFFDEAHKTVNNKIFGKMLNDSFCKISFRIFFTATPRFYKGNSNKSSGMNDVNKYGKVEYNYSFNQATEDKYILNFKIICMTVPPCMNDIIYEKYIKKDKLLGTEHSRDIICAVQLGNFIKENKNDTNICKCLTYHNTVNNATNFMKILNYIFCDMKVSAKIYMMSGKTNISQRHSIIDEFTDSITSSIICSSKVLNEGIDIPCVNTIMFVQPRKSTVDVTQCMSRGNRLYKNQKCCKIIIPIHYNNVENNNEYTTIIDTLSAMTIIDNTMVEYFITKKENTKLEIRMMKIVCDKEDYEDIDIKYNIRDVIKNIKNITIKKNKINLKSEIRNKLIRENKNRINKNEQLIDTKNKCYEYLGKENKKILGYQDNWVKFCVGDKIFNIIKDKYYETTNDIIEACKQLNIYTCKEYAIKYKKDNRLPSIEYIDNGFYNEYDNKINLQLLLNKCSCDNDI
jgi:predicted helicase